MLLDQVGSEVFHIEEADGFLSVKPTRPLIVTNSAPRKAFFKKMRRHAGAEVKNKRTGTRLKMRDGVVRGNSFAGNYFGQRVIVKINPVQNRTKGVGVGAGSGAKNLYQHVRYISRSGAGKEETRAVLFDRENDGVDGLAFHGLCKDDRHHFRMIISPENGHGIDDFQGYVRGVMGLMESDLGTSLEWVGAVHYDTDDVHAHVIIRGVNARGQDLVIGRDYIAGGIRARAQELATELLGERSLEQIQKAQEGEVERLSVTSFDRFIEKRLDDDRQVDVRKGNNFGKSSHYEGLVKGRLKFLAGTGLAAEYPPGVYTLKENFIEVLRESSQRQNVLSALYRQKPDMNFDGLKFYSTKAGEGEVLHGTVAEKGSVDEISDRKYLMVRDMDLNLHYVPFGDLKDFEKLVEGSLVRVAPGEGSTGKADYNIAQIARNNGGIYDRAHHLAYIEVHMPQMDEDARSGYLASHERRIETLRQNGVVESIGENCFRVPDGVIERGAEITREMNIREQKRFYPKLEVLSMKPVQKLVELEKKTWLDRELYRKASGKESLDRYSAEVRDALEKRKSWLVSKELAEFSSEGAFALRDGALKKLDLMEIYAAGQKLSSKLGYEFDDRIVTPNVAHQYEGSIKLESGHWAVVSRDSKLQMVRVKGMPDTEIGKDVLFDPPEKGVAQMYEVSRSQKKLSEQDKDNEKEVEK
ncbi:MAG: DUF3363 domain-containing protein [Candidatus Vecturithrix sp.]|jgi:type IV secretory pathway VirD2 relaxase|nr:DUF3363 domain-containing protein [Candidatus Vecturithrix sp.]